MKKNKGKGKKHLKKAKLYQRFKKFLGSFIPLMFIMVIYALPVIAEETEGPGQKLAEGIKETATGWVEIPREMAETSEETGLVEGLTVGTIKGAGEAIVETTEGAVKAATFYIPEEEQEEEQEEKQEEKQEEEQE